MAKKRRSRTASKSYSMPEMSGLYGRPPFEYRDARQMLVVFQTDPRVLRKLVPRPLTPDKDGTMFIAMSEFFTSGMGSYKEMNIAGIASFKRRPVINRMLPPRRRHGIIRFDRQVARTNS